MVEAKKRAAERQSNVSEIVNEALRQAFRTETPGPTSERFQMPTYRPPSFLPVDTGAAELHDLLVAEDMKPYGP